MMVPALVALVVVATDRGGFGGGRPGGGGFGGPYVRLMNKICMTRKEEGRERIFVPAFFFSFIILFSNTFENVIDNVWENTSVQVHALLRRCRQVCHRETKEYGIVR